MNKVNAIMLSVVILFIAVFSYIALSGLKIGIYEIVPIGQKIQEKQLGLDLKGGSYRVYEAKVNPGDSKINEKISGAIKVIRRRLDSENQTEAVVSRQGENRIRVEVPGVYDREMLDEILGKPAKLEFVDPDGNIILTGKDIKTANPGYDRGAAVVYFELHADGAKKFGEITNKLKDKTNRSDRIIKIVLDGEPISQPAVESAILDGKGQITGMGDIEEAKLLANYIESGALPVELVKAQETTIGATLGAEALNKGLLAGIIGISVVFLFMLIFYRLPGLIANLALILYILIILYTIVFAKVTLTLPGIAGIILSVGMAVDANVIIFERIKEEIRSGKSLRASMDSGFSKAFRAVLDSNITTLLAATVLLYFGTGPIQGFAKTLIIGIIASMFTAISFTRYIIRLIIGLNIESKKLFGA